jgi:hypothetical protein
VAVVGRGRVGSGCVTVAAVVIRLLEVKANVQIAHGFMFVKMMNMASLSNDRDMLKGSGTTSKMERGQSET